MHVQVLDQATNEWICVEEMCVPGKEVMVFCGKALERTTGQSKSLHISLFLRGPKIELFHSFMCLINAALIWIVSLHPIHIFSKTLISRIFVLHVNLQSCVSSCFRLWSS
jgi:hypothetical protein